MAFLDDFGKKISHAGQSAVQKTKDMTDLARINGMINDAEQRITNAYHQIGKLYAVLHAADYEDEFAGMMNTVREAEMRIAEYRQQILTIKGVVCCEKCGAEVSNNSAFCSSCGNAMPVTANKIACRSCGQLVEKGVRFCTFCGKPTMDFSAPSVAEPEKVSAASSVTDPEVAPVAVPEPVSQSTVRFCTNCGTKLSDGAMFCTECGTKLS